jgi:hypothetical protein
VETLGRGAAGKEQPGLDEDAVKEDTSERPGVGMTSEEISGVAITREATSGVGVDAVSEVGVL